MQRQLGDERARYGRKSLREELADALHWPAANRFATGIVVVVVVGAVLIALAGGKSRSAEGLGVGDCLYIATESALDPTAIRPIGDEASVELVLVAGGAQEAGCTASHGHEVSAILTGPDPSPRSSGIGSEFDRAAIHKLMQPLCEAAFAAYVGRDPRGSAYGTFAAVPEAPQWIASGRRTICLVARNDGTWMDHPARGSGE